MKFDGRKPHVVFYGVAVMSHMFIELVFTRTLFERQGTPCSEQSKILVTATGFEPTIT